MNVNVTARGASRHKNCPTHTSLSASLLGQLKRIRRGPRDGRRSTERTLVSNYCRGRVCVTETRGNASCDDRRHTRQCKTGVYIYTPTCRGTCSACMTHCAHRGAHRIFFPGEGHRRGKGSVVGGVAPWRVLNEASPTLGASGAAKLASSARSAEMRPFPTHVASIVVCALDTRVNCAKPDEPTEIPFEPQKPCRPIRSSMGHG